MSDFDRIIDYSERYQQAVLGMLRGILEEVAEDGVPGDHAFYVSFDTTNKDVHLSPTLRANYPEQMTIVLQNQFWGLSMDDEGFNVTLRFGGSPETLRVPWKALTGFADPSAEFGIQLQAAETKIEAEPVAKDPTIAEGDDASRFGHAQSAETVDQVVQDSGTAGAGDGPVAVSEDAVSEEDAAVLDFADFKKRS